MRWGSGWGNVAVAVFAAGALLPFGCGGLPGVPLANESTMPVDTDRFELVARFVHISDAQIVDEEKDNVGRAIGSRTATGQKGQQRGQPGHP